jgi:hypothetical protein
MEFISGTGNYRSIQNRPLTSRALEFKNAISITVRPQTLVPNDSCWNKFTSLHSSEFPFYLVLGIPLGCALICNVCLPFMNNSHSCLWPRRPENWREILPSSCTFCFIGLTPFTAQTLIWGQLFSPVWTLFTLLELSYFFCTSKKGCFKKSFTIVFQILLCGKVLGDVRL